MSPEQLNNELKQFLTSVTKEVTQLLGGGHDLRTQS